MRRKLFFFSIFFIFLFLPSAVFASTTVSFNSSWQYANESKIHSGQAVLYNASSNSNGYTVAINAGHGTKGGESVKTYCHPDHTPKVTGGSTEAGAIQATSISSGMTFNDGTPEATVTLRMAQITRDLLLENGFDVLMIRDGADVQLDNIARTVIANNNADIHLAIHWDSSTSNKGAFFMSVPNNASYRNMEPVKSHWQEHNELGQKIISVMKNDGINIFSNGEMEMDLTQTSYSTIPSIDIEFGDKVSSHDDATLRTLANAFVHGISEYFNTTFKPSNNQGSGNSNTVSSSVLNLNEFSLTNEEKALLEEAMKSWPSQMEAGRLEVIKKALSLIGKGVLYSKPQRADPDNPNPKYHDCSSYVSWMFYQAGFDIGDKTTDKFASDTTNFSEINKSDLIPGDIALNSRDGGGDTGSINHVGLYFGSANGKNVYLHSTNYNGVSGPQIRHGEHSFKVYFRYKNFGDEMTNVGGSGSSTPSNNGLKEDEYEGNGFRELEVKDIDCTNIFMESEGTLNELGEFVQGLFTLIKLAAPALVIILSTVDYVKAITNSDDSEMKKATQRTIKRIIFGFLIFLLPFLLDLLFHLFGLYDLSTCGIGGDISEIIEEDPGD